MGLISDELYQVTKLLLLMSGGNGRMIVKSPDSDKDMTKTSCFSLLRGSTTLIGARQPDRMRTVGKIKKRKRHIRRTSAAARGYHRLRR